MVSKRKNNRKLSPPAILFLEAGTLPELELKVNQAIKEKYSLAELPEAHYTEFFSSHKATMIHLPKSKRRPFL